MEIPQNPLFCVCCIDKRFDALTTDYFESTEYKLNYYLGTTAGSGLPLGYKQYCTEIYDCNCDLSTCTPCNPLNPDMELLERSLIRNIEIAQTLDSIPEIYIINHQDCGAIKAFLSCSIGNTNPISNFQLLYYSSNIKQNNFFTQIHMFFCFTCFKVYYFMITCFIVCSNIVNIFPTLN